MEEKNEWFSWLDDQAMKTGYTKEQLEKAREVTLQIPKIFVLLPVVDEEEGVMFVTWRTKDWTLIIEIDPSGSEQWWANNFLTGKLIENKEYLFQELDRENDLRS